MIKKMSVKNNKKKELIATFYEKNDITIFCTLYQYMLNVDYLATENFQFVFQSTPHARQSISLFLYFSFFVFIFYIILTMFIVLLSSLHFLHFNFSY